MKNSSRDNGRSSGAKVMGESERQDHLLPLNLWGTAGGEKGETDGMGASLSLKQIQRDMLGANHIYQRGGMPFRWQISSLPRTVPLPVSSGRLHPGPRLQGAWRFLASKLPGWSLGLCRELGGCLEKHPCPTPSSDSPTRESHRTP